MSKIKKRDSSKKFEAYSSINNSEHLSTEDIGDNLCNDLNNIDKDFRRSRITGRLSLISSNKPNRKTTTLVSRKNPLNVNSLLPKRPSDSFKSAETKAKMEYIGSCNQVCNNCKSRINNMTIEITVSDDVNFDNLENNIGEMKIMCPICGIGKLSVSLFSIKETKNRIKNQIIDEGDLAYESGGN